MGGSNKIVMKKGPRTVSATVLFCLLLCSWYGAVDALPMRDQRVGHGHGGAVSTAAVRQDNMACEEEIAECVADLDQQTCSSDQGIPALEACCAVVIPAMECVVEAAENCANSNIQGTYEETLQILKETCGEADGSDDGDDNPNDDNDDNPNLSEECIEKTQACTQLGSTECDGENLTDECCAAASEAIDCLLDIADECLDDDSKSAAEDAKELLDALCSGDGNGDGGDGNGDGGDGNGDDTCVEKTQECAELGSTQCDGQNPTDECCAAATKAIDCLLDIADECLDDAAKSAAEDAKELLDSLCSTGNGDGDGGDGSGDNDGGDGDDNDDGEGNGDGDGNDGGDGNGDGDDEGNTQDPQDPPQNPQDSGSDPACFPAGATVRLENGSTKTMRELAAGDRVQVAGGAFSDVFGFGHRAEAVKSEFVLLETENGAVLELSPSHYLPDASGKLIAARNLGKGDTVKRANGSDDVVSRVSRVHREGLFNPHTLEGTIVVNDIVASTYTEAVHPTLAHLLLAIPRALYRIGFKEPLGSVLYDSTPAFVRALVPKGSSVV